MLRTLLPLTVVTALAATAPAGAATLTTPVSVKVTEGKAVLVTAKLARKATKRTIVRWTLTGASDFARTKGSLVIRKGRRAGTLRLLTRQDALLEGSETYTLRLGRKRIKVVLADDERPAPAPQPTTPPAPPAPEQPAPEQPAPEPLPAVSVGDLTRSEGLVDEAKKPAVTLSAPAKANVVVRVTATGKTATAGPDFDALSTDVTIPAGQTTAPVPLKVVSDTTDELDAETLELTLSAPQGATIGDATGEVTITDDDPKPVLNVANGTPRLENNTTMPFTVSLSRASYQQITVTLATAAGTAGGGTLCSSPGADFISLTGLQVTFAPGETSKTVNVTICEDNAPEADETFTVIASNLSSGATMGDNSGAGTIQQDSD